jgi:hypothetical protein
MAEEVYTVRVHHEPGEGLWFDHRTQDAGTNRLVLTRVVSPSFRRATAA